MGEGGLLKETTGKKGTLFRTSTGGPSPVKFTMVNAVVQWHPFSPFFSGCPTKIGLPQKGFLFFPTTKSTPKSSSPWWWDFELWFLRKSRTLESFPDPSHCNTSPFSLWLSDGNLASASQGLMSQDSWPLAEPGLLGRNLAMLPGVQARFPREDPGTTICQRIDPLTFCCSEKTTCVSTPRDHGL